MEKHIGVDGAESLIQALKSESNTKVRVAIETLLDGMINQLDRPVTQKDLTDPQWAFVRAYRDGGKFYLLQLLDIFKEKDNG